MNAGPSSSTLLRIILQEYTGSEEMSRERLLPLAVRTTTCLVASTLGKVGTLTDQLMVSWAPHIPFTPASSSNSVTRQLCLSKAITQQTKIVHWKSSTRLIPTGPSPLLKALTQARLSIQKKLERGPIIWASQQRTNFEQKKRSQ